MAKPVHKDSNDCSSPSLDLFLLPPTQSSLQKGWSIVYYSIISLSDGGPIEFKVSGSERNFSVSHAHICISKLRYQRQMVSIYIVRKVGFVNYPIASLFYQVDEYSWTSGRNRHLC